MLLNFKFSNYFKVKNLCSIFLGNKVQLPMQNVKEVTTEEKSPARLARVVIMSPLPRHKNYNTKWSSYKMTKNSLKLNPLFVFVVIKSNYVPFFSLIQ